MENKKKLGLDAILSEIKSGLRPSQISEKYSIPKQTLDYSVGKLKKLGCIKKVGYGTWEFIHSLKEVPIRHKDTKPGHSDLSKKRGEKEIRGHAFIWRIEFEKYFNWEAIIKNYKRKKLTFEQTLDFQLICRNKVHRLIFNSRKVWLTKNGMVIYEPLDFFGNSSFEIKGTAVFQMDRLIKDLLSELGTQFSRYRFTTSREHYGIVKNELARQFNDRKEKMIIRTLDGSPWLWIDDSKGLAELETADPTLNREVQNFWNSHKKHKFKHDADFVEDNFKEAAKQIQKNAENLDYHAENMRSHVGATKDLSAAAVELKNGIDDLMRLIKNKL